MGLLYHAHAVVVQMTKWLILGRLGYCTVHSLSEAEQMEPCYFSPSVVLEFLSTFISVLLSWTTANRGLLDLIFSNVFLLLI